MFCSVLWCFVVVCGVKCHPQYFLLRKCEKLLHCKSFSHFFQQKISVYLVINSIILGSIIVRL